MMNIEKRQATARYLCIGRLVLGGVTLTKCQAHSKPHIDNESNTEADRFLRTVPAPWNPEITTSSFEAITENKVCSRLEGADIDRAIGDPGVALQIPAG